MEVNVKYLLVSLMSSIYIPICTNWSAYKKDKAKKNKAVAAISMSSGKGLRALRAAELYAANSKRWDAFNVLRKVKFISAVDGKLEGQFKVTPDMCNSASVLAGGFSSAVVDVASMFAYASHEKGTLGWSIALQIQYTSFGAVDDLIKVKAAPLSLSRKMAVYDCSLEHAETGKLIARGTVNFLASSEKAVRDCDIDYEP